MATYQQTDADQMLGAVIVRIITTEDEKAVEALILPLSDEQQDVHVDHAYVELSAHGERFPVPLALEKAQNLATTIPGGRQVLVQLHDGAQWDNAWGSLLPLRQSPS